VVGMNDTELDALLTASRPEDEHDPDCAACRAALTRRPAHPWRRRLAVAGAAGVTVVAIGAGAAATVGLPFVDHDAPVKHTQTVSNGDQCQSTFTVHAEGGHRSDPESVEAAKAILAGLDLDALDISEELASLKEEYAHTTWEGPGPEPDYQYALDSQDMLENQALSRAVMDEISTGLRAQGLRPGQVSLVTESLCDDHEMATRR